MPGFKDVAHPSWLREVLYATDIETLGWFLQWRFDVEVPEEKLFEWCELAIRKGFPAAWGDSTITSWLKNRMMFSRFFPEGKDETEIRLKSPLNFFFIFLHETPEMVARIRVPEPEKKKRKKSGVARSKIGKTLLENLCPVNRVAARVVPEE